MSPSTGRRMNIICIVPRASCFEQFFVLGFLALFRTSSCDFFEIFLLELLWLTAGGTMASCGGYDGLLWRSIVWELLSLIVGVNLLIREAAIAFF